MTAESVFRPDPDDPTQILALLPDRWHDQFLAEYRAALDAAREVGQWPQLRALLHRWRLRATAYSDPGFDAAAHAARDARPRCGRVTTRRVGRDIDGAAPGSATHPGTHSALDQHHRIDDFDLPGTRRAPSGSTSHLKRALNRPGFIRGGRTSSERFEADYLVVGAGAMGLAFTDTLVAESDATVVVVDRNDQPGGHWTMAYPFVRLHHRGLNAGLDGPLQFRYRHSFAARATRRSLRAQPIGRAGL